MSNLSPGANGDSELYERKRRSFHPVVELLARWRTIMLVTLVAIITAGLISLILPARYTARTTLYVAESQGDSRLQALASQLPSGMLGIGGSGGGDSRMIGIILESRSLRDSVSSQFGSFRPLTSRRNPDGSIVIEIEHSDPTTAAEIANLYPQVMNRIAASISANTNRQRQEFLRQQIQDAQARLLAAEDQLVRFQQGSQAPELEEQARRTVEAAAELQRRVVEKEIEVAQLRRTVTASNPQLQAAEAELQAWRGQLRRMMEQRGQSGLYVPLQDSPELKAEAYRLLRNFKAEEQIFVSLTAALAQAEIDGRNTLPVVSVIDVARVPSSPTGIGIAVLLVFAALVGLFIGVLIVLVRAWWKTAREEPANTPMVAAWDGFVADVSHLLPISRRRERV